MSLKPDRRDYRGSALTGRRPTVPIKAALDFTIADLELAISQLHDADVQTALGTLHYRIVSLRRLIEEIG